MKLLPNYASAIFFSRKKSLFVLFMQCTTYVFENYMSFFRKLL